MNIRDIIMIIIPLLVGLGMGSAFCIPIIFKYKKELKEKDTPIITEEYITSKNVKYSKDVMSFVKEFTVQVCVLKYRNFFDNHSIDKVTKGQLQSLVSDTAREVNNSLRLKSIDYEKTLFTKEFVDSFIIETTMVALKDLLDKSVVEILEQ